ncbi:MAG: hypothetical protein ACK5SI_10715 [Planctomycetia bacterium]|jgi:hypothetical protein
MLVEIGQVIDAPADVLAAVRSRLGLPVGDAEPTYRTRHFIHGGQAALVRELLPEACELYEQMCRLAGCQPHVPAELRIHRPDGDAEDAIRAWARRSRTLAAVRPAAAA